MGNKKKGEGRNIATLQSEIKSYLAKKEKEAADKAFRLDDDIHEKYAESYADEDEQEKARERANGFEKDIVAMIAEKQRNGDNADYNEVAIAYFEDLLNSAPSDDKLSKEEKTKIEEENARIRIIYDYYFEKVNNKPEKKKGNPNLKENTQVPALEKETEDKEIIKKKHLDYLKKYENPNFREFLSDFDGGTGAGGAHLRIEGFNLDSGKVKCVLNDLKKEEIDIDELDRLLLKEYPYIVIENIVRKTKDVLEWLQEKNQETEQKPQEPQKEFRRIITLEEQRREQDLKNKFEQKYTNVLKTKRFNANGDELFIFEYKDDKARCFFTKKGNISPEKPSSEVSLAEMDAILKEYSYEKSGLKIELETQTETNDKENEKEKMIANLPEKLANIFLNSSARALESFRADLSGKNGGENFLDKYTSDEDKQQLLKLLVKPILRELIESKRKILTERFGFSQDNEKELETYIFGSIIK